MSAVTGRKTEAMTNTGERTEIVTDISNRAWPVNEKKQAGLVSWADKKRA